MALLMLSLGVCSCKKSDTSGDTDNQSTAEVNTEAEEKSKEYSVLFIGNSLTFYNDMPTEFFEPIARMAGYNVKITEITNPGHYLCEHANMQDEFGAKVRKALAENKFDYVIMQDQSRSSIVGTVEFYDSVRVLSELVKRSGAQLCLYSTWGYAEEKTASPTAKELAGSTEGMEMMIRSAYSAIADEVGAKCIRAGAGMTYAYKNSDLNIYYEDYQHPSAIGSCIEGWSLFCDIFGVSPEAVDFRYDAFTDAQIEDIRKAVSYAVSTESLVPEENKVSSVGKSDIAHDFSSGVDIDKTVNLTNLPQSELVTVVNSDTKPTAGGWRKRKDNDKYYSSIRGGKDAVASEAESAEGLTDAQKADIADIGYGISVIGAEKVEKDGIKNLINGAWGNKAQAKLIFDGKKYDVQGNATADGKYAGLITLNFTEEKTFDSIGYFGNTIGEMAHAQDVFVSNDGKTWTKVESACYDIFAMNKADRCLSEIEEKEKDLYSESTAEVQRLFSMEGANGKYIRIGIILGCKTDRSIVEALPNKTQYMECRELLVFGK